jgi:hypothetical protein
MLRAVLSSVELLLQHLAGNRSWRTPVEHSVATQPVKPHTGAGIAVTASHRDQTHVHAVAIVGHEHVAGHQILFARHGDRAERVLAAVLAREPHLLARDQRAGRSYVGSARHRCDSDWQRKEA